MFSQEIKIKMLEEAQNCWPKRWSVIEKMFNHCCLSISYDIILKKLELFKYKHLGENIETIGKKIKLFKEAEYVVEKMLYILEEEKIIEKKDSLFYLAGNSDIDIESPSEAIVKAVKNIPEEIAAFQWLARAYGGMWEFINGHAYGEEIMFPWNDFSLVKEVYDTSGVYGFWSNLSGKIVKNIVEEKNNIKLLEVGAGTGNGTLNVLNNLNEPETIFEQYLYTDISKLLIRESKKKFSMYNFIDYKQLDIMIDSASKGLDNKQFDIVLAVNVLHATSNIKLALNNIKNLLKTGGYLVIGEISPPEDGMYRYMELTFGMLGSYYKYNDKELRPNMPIITQDKWIEILDEIGFSGTLAIPHNNIIECNRGGVLIAKK